MAGSGLSGEYVLPVRSEVELRLQTYDQWKNPILTERDWSGFSVEVAQLPQQGNMTYES